MSERVRRLWAAVLCQAFEDLRDADYGSLIWNEAVAFFFSPGWSESRRCVCDFLGLDPSDLHRPALRLLNARRLQVGLPPLHPQPAHTPATGPRLPMQRVSEPTAAVPPQMPLPRLVAVFKDPEPAPERRGRAGGWRSRYAFNPFAPLPSEQRAATRRDAGSGD